MNHLNKHFWIQKFVCYISTTFPFSPQSSRSFVCISILIWHESCGILGNEVRSVASVTMLRRIFEELWIKIFSPSLPLMKYKKGCNQQSKLEKPSLVNGRGRPHSEGLNALPYFPKCRLKKIFCSKKFPPVFWGGGKFYYILKNI